MSLLGIFSIFSTVGRSVKESLEPTIPAENWANKELYHQDLMSGMSVEERMRNVRNGRYKLTETYPEPHRDPKSGKIIIENNLLYKEDLKKYGASQTYKWVRQGKYNLTPEELEKEHKRLDEEYEKLYRLASPYNKSKEQLEEKQRKEAELVEKKKLARELDDARRTVLKECRKILTEANYNNIEFSLKHCTNIDNEPHGYNVGQISMQKNCGSYIVGFEVLSRANLPEINGNLLIKSLSTMLAAIDISDYENCKFTLKEALKSENITLRNEHEEFNIDNDTLNIVVTICSLEVLLKFYTSKVKNPSHRINFDAMDGHEFEFFCANILKQNGFENVSVTSGSGDQGVDIIAYKDDIKYGIQCKCYHSDIGNKAVQEVFSGKAFYNCHVGIVLTNRDFTRSAVDLARNNGVILWNRKKLLQMIENLKN